MDNSVTTEQRQARIQKVTIVGLIANLFLSVGQVLAGVLGRSAAMVSDGVHSVSDVVLDGVVLIFVRISGHKRDRRLSFGYGKFETFATLLIVVVLIIIGGELFVSGLRGIADVLRGEPREAPRAIALWAAVVSILVKEALYQYTARSGRRVGSPVLEANAWHHRADALSSFGSLIGIGLAMLLGGRWVLLDPLVSCAISLFLIVEAVRMALPALKELLDYSLPDDVTTEMTRIAEQVDGVVDIHCLKTFRNGPSIVAEAHLSVRGDITVTEAHKISTAVEQALINRYGAGTQITLHIEPEGNCIFNTEETAQP